VGLESLEIMFTYSGHIGHLDSSIDPKRYELDIYSLFKFFPDSLKSVSIINVHLVFNYDDNDEYTLGFRQIKTLSLSMINLKTPQIKWFHFKTFAQPEILVHRFNTQLYTPIFNTQPQSILFGNLTIPYFLLQ
jgi:hypothetical protein